MAGSASGARWAAWILLLVVLIVFVVVPLLERDHHLTVAPVESPSK